MNRAIALDYQTCFAAVEVCDVFSELMLPPEFQAQQLTISQELPEFSFRKGFFCSQRADKTRHSGRLITATILSGFLHQRCSTEAQKLNKKTSLFSSPHPRPFSQREKGENMMLVSDNSSRLFADFGFDVRVLTCQGIASIGDGEPAANRH